ncbi:photoreceptor outer segment membrane glycoprotein 2-like [Euwallacea similis]|uniref:photoreceptor outer segment membrane glycoprotein 2-like n=1 Tax=Euwallacea similis TaxID=1736056 RepID=UPI00344DA5F8
MAIGLCKLNGNQRKSLRSIFCVLNIIEVLIGATITGVSIYVCVAISPTIISEKAEINLIFIVYAIFGINIMINWLIGLKICNKCINQAHKKSTNNLLLLWYCAGTNTVITLIIIANFSTKANKHIAKSMKNSIQGDMKLYFSDPESKETIDRIQYGFECCGYESYKDWYDVEWLNSDIINTKASLVQEIRFGSEKLNLPIVPFSCCKIDYPLQCLHDPLQQVEFTNVWVDKPNTVTDSLNTIGCVEKMKIPLEQFVDGFVMVVSAVTFLHVIIIALSRFLYTSARNAILLFDPEGVAPGWIFGRGDCGYARGKTLTELMGITSKILEKRIVNQKRKGKSRSKGITSETSMEFDFYGQTASSKTVF